MLRASIAEFTKYILKLRKRFDRETAKNISEVPHHKLQASILIHDRSPTRNLLARAETGEDEHRKM
jgi:hypothetical protein